MTTIRIADTESDGLLDQATQLWCISSIDYEDEDNAIKHYPPDSIDAGLAWLHDCDVLVLHNAIKHDMPLLKKLYGWEPKSHQAVLDTLIMSRMLYPKRPIPQGCPTNKTHSVEAWGYRLGVQKPEHEDWTKYTDDMRVRCNQDVYINRMILKELERESELQELFYQKALQDIRDEANSKRGAEAGAEDS